MYLGGIDIIYEKELSRCVREGKVGGGEGPGGLVV